MIWSKTPLLLSSDITWPITIIFCLASSTILASASPANIPPVAIAVAAIWPPVAEVVAAEVLPWTILVPAIAPPSVIFMAAWADEVRNGSTTPWYIVCITEFKTVETIWLSNWLTKLSANILPASFAEVTLASVITFIKSPPNDSPLILLNMSLWDWRIPIYVCVSAINVSTVTPKLSAITLSWSGLIWSK